MKDIKKAFKAKEIKKMICAIHTFNEGDESYTLKDIYEYMDFLIDIEDILEENAYLTTSNKALQGKLNNINEVINELDCESISKVLDPATYTEEGMNKCFLEIKGAIDMTRIYAQTGIPDEEIPF